MEPNTPQQYRGKDIVAVLQNPSGVYYAVIPSSREELNRLESLEGNPQIPRVVAKFSGVNIEFLALTDQYVETLCPKSKVTKVDLQDILSFAELQ